MDHKRKGSLNYGKRLKRQNSGAPNSEYLSDDTSHVSGPLDPVFGQHKAFPISHKYKSLANVCLDDAATDVHAYLAMVRLEAETGQQVVYVERDRVDCAEDDSVGYDTVDKSSLEQNELHHQWHEKFINYFKQLKIQSEQTVPGLIEEKDLPNTFANWRIFVLSTEPKMSQVLALEHELSMKLIIYATKWLNRNTNVCLSKWILSLFVKISNILNHSDCSTLRDLAKKAVKLKGTEVSEIARYTNDMIISVVGDYFGQKDLLTSYMSSKMSSKIENA